MQHICKQISLKSELFAHLLANVHFLLYLCKLNVHEQIDNMLRRKLHRTIVLLISFLPHVARYLSRRTWKSTQMQQLALALSQLSYTRFMQAIGWSAMRYVVWAVQLALTLHFCGVNMLPIEYMIAIPFYYMVIAIFPSMPVLNIAIRGTWSLIIFDTFSDNTAGIALAVLLIWIINTVIPMLIGSVLYRNGKTK